MKKNYTIPLKFLIILTNILFFHSNIYTEATSNEQWLTVFVHGTVGSPFSVFNPDETFNDIYTNPLYKKIQDLFRNNRFNARIRFLSPQGLHKVDFSLKTRSTQVISLYKDILLLTNPIQAQQTHFYTFGWSGFLSQKERLTQACILYLDLWQEVQQFRKQGVIPKIRLIAHSHGGNVCLNLVPIHKLFGYDFYIDELLLCATPIQEETERFAYNSLWKTVYNIYAESDVIQLVDFFSTKGKSNKRTLAQTHSKKKHKAPKIIQLRILIGHKTHKHLIQEVFIDTESYFDLLKDWYHNVKLYPDDPSHMHFFDIIPQIHKSFIYPLPVVALFPFIFHSLAACKQIPEQVTAGTDLNVAFELDKDSVSCSIINNQTEITYGQTQLPYSCISGKHI